MDGAPDVSEDQWAKSARLDDEPTHEGDTTTTAEDRAETGRVLSMLDRALSAAQPLIVARVERLRDRNPDATPSELTRKLELTFMSSMTATGAATGATAAVPGVGTGAALALTAGDASWFLTASVVHVLSVLQVHGIRLGDLEHQKAVVLAVLAGGGGSGFFGKAAERTGPHLGRLLADSVPSATIRSANKVLGHNFVTRYGTRQGILVLGKAAPFGFGMAIGAGGNLLMARAVVKATRVAIMTAVPTAATDSTIEPDESIVG
ncbi:hypothetical protein [Nocardia sp. NPDC058633]|uniref:hypothetical protein n=1 Tax=Nocardia sp. NPDC058633 TaxID=3346568 RepID=UPI00364EC9BB